MGTDWKRKSILTLRHATGASKYTSVWLFISWIKWDIYKKSMQQNMSVNIWKIVNNCKYYINNWIKILYDWPAC